MEMSDARLVPTLVPTFTDSKEIRRAERILCGPTSQLRRSIISCS